MIEPTETKRSTTVLVPLILSRHWAALGLLYVAGYVLLDWISLIQPYAPFGISPWNPGTGLSFALVLLFGRRMLPFLFVGVLLSDLVHRPLPLPWMVELAAALLIAGGYAAALLALMQKRLRFDPALSSMRDLLLLMVAAVVSAAVVACGYVGLAIAAGLLPPADFSSAALRYWVGDVIGIMVVTPFSLLALTRRRVLPMSIETWLQFAAILAALALVLGYSDERQFQLFYVLFLPIVWMAVRAGSEGVAVGILVIQLGLIVGFILFPEEASDVTAFQALMLVLAATGLIAGELVTERRRTETQLRLHQDSLSRLARLGSMGELAAAIAASSTTRSQPAMPTPRRSRRPPARRWRRSSAPPRWCAACARWCGSTAATAPRSTSIASCARRSRSASRSSIASTRTHASSSRPTCRS
jgi:integral membrane sensor domain MASE1